MAKKMAKSVYEVLEEHGVQNEKIGIDVMDLRGYQELTGLGLKIVNAWPALSEARVVKTRDEIECLKISSAYGDAAMWMAINEWTKPGVTRSVRLREGERVPVRERLRLRLRHHRGVGRQHEPVSSLAHRQGDPPGRPR